VVKVKTLFLTCRKKPTTYPVNEKRAIGVKGLATAQNTHEGTMFGGYFEGKYGFSNVGVEGTAGNADATGSNVGGKFTGVGNNNINYGVWGIANGGTLNYAVFGSTFSTGYSGYFDGDVYIAGTYGPSDANLKTNIQDYDSALYVINLLQPKTFEYDNTNFQGMSLSQGHKYGLIAQEVEQVLPALVKEQTHPAQDDSFGNEINFKGMDYDGLIPILIGGIKEQQNLIMTQDSVINNLNLRLTALENCLSGILPFLCQLSNSSIQQNDEQTQQHIIKELNVTLDNSQSIVLGQNVPNPFAEQTVIEYYIPEAVNQAQIIFYNQPGQIIKTVNIEEMGNGRLTVFGNDLSTGIYTYTLIADGQVIATKKMMKTK
jgi:hypothetical protein